MMRVNSALTVFSQCKHDETQKLKNFPRPITQLKLRGQSCMRVHNSIAVQALIIRPKHHH